MYKFFKFLCVCDRPSKPLRIAICSVILVLFSAGKSFATDYNIVSFGAKADDKTLNTPNLRYEINFEGSKWISVSDTLFAPNQWICFRKSFDLNGKEPSSKLYIAVDSKYWLWINGKMVVFEGGLKRGPNPADTYYDHVDIAPFLQKGKNTIAILMWYWGREGFCHKNSDKPGLLAALTSGKKSIIGSDETWKVKIHPAYDESGPPYPNHRLPEFNIHFDARKDIPGWENPGYNDADWATATVHGIYPCAPWNKLHERPFPNWYDSGIIDYEEIVRETVGDSLTITAKLPRNISITPYLKINAKAGELIDIRSDNYKGGSEYNVRAEYVTKDGVQEFEAFNYINGHSVIYTLPKGVEMLSVGYRETRFPTEHVGKFECNDEFYNKLWMKSLYTMNMNMRDAIQDPDRERSQWWGDAVIVSGEILYTCDVNGCKLIDKAIRNLVDWQKPNGVLYSPVPAGSWDQELPAQMLASVGRYGFWNYYLYSAEKELIAYVYPHVKKYLALWSFNERGLLHHRAGDWDWWDWGRQKDAAVMENAWYSIALESAANMASLLGYTADAESYRKTMETIKQAVNNHLWNGREYRSPDYNGNTDDCANGLAVLAGFADREKWNSIHHFLNGYANATPYMEKYVLESYFQQGEAEDGLKRMKNRYRIMVEHPLSTLWEDWIIGGAGGGSINHGWAGGPLILLSQYVAGVYPVEAGWKTFMIKPQLGNLQWVKCTVPAGDKTIRVELNKTANSFDMNVQTTLKTAYYIAVPKIDGASGIEIDGQKYALDQLSGLKGNIRFDKSDADYFYLVTDRQNVRISIK